MTAALCLSRGDWMFPTYRDAVAVMTRGEDPGQLMTIFLVENNKYAISLPMAHQSMAR